MITKICSQFQSFINTLHKFKYSLFCFFHLLLVNLLFLCLLSVDNQKSNRSIHLFFQNFQPLMNFCLNEGLQGGNFLVEEIEENWVAAKDIIGLRKLKCRESVIGELCNELFMFVIEGYFNMFEGFIKYLRSKKDFVEFVIVGWGIKFHVI